MEKVNGDLYRITNSGDSIATGRTPSELGRKYMIGIIEGKQKIGTLNFDKFHPGSEGRLPAGENDPERQELEDKVRFYGERTLREIILKEYFKT